MSGLTEHRREQIEMHRQVADMYRRRSGYAFSEAFQQERNDLLLGMTPADDDGLAVDLGCGTGILLDRLAGRFARVVGLDSSQEMLDGYVAGPTARGAVILLRGDMTQLPLRDASCDVVLCRSALHHMDDEVAVLREMRRVLKPGGSLVLGEPANDNVLTRLARAWVRRRPSFGRIHTIDRAYTRAQLRELLARAGLSVVREERFGFLAYPLCDNPDLVPVLKHLPAGLASALGAGLRALDRLLARVPLLRNQSWYAMLEARPVP
ncbi:MAG: methyltransferase domain-containing protein [Planctomycetes bacterium]|nr:methyltransferase domain-containing protein [Planctomycetota bacterium]